MQAVFYGVGASVIGIISISACKLTQKTIGTSKLLWAIYLISALATFITENGHILLFLSAGLLVFAIRTPLWKPSSSTTTGFLFPPVAVLATSKASLGGKRPGIVAFVDGVTAAAVGAIAGACVVLGRRTIFDSNSTPEIPKIVLLLVTIGILLRYKKLPEPFIVIGAALIGLIIYPFVR